jgi:hypothetical protein
MDPMVDVVQMCQVVPQRTAHRFFADSLFIASVEPTSISNSGSLRTAVGRALTLETLVAVSIVKACMPPLLNLKPIAGIAVTRDEGFRQRDTRETSSLNACRDIQPHGE